MCRRATVVFRTYIGSGGSRNGAIGGAVGWRGGRGRGPPTHQQGGMGERCKLPIGAWGGAPEAFTFFASKPLKISVYSQRSERIYIRAKNNEVYCDSAPRNGRQQASKNIGYARVSKPYFSSILSL